MMPMTSGVSPGRDCSKPDQKAEKRTDSPRKLKPFLVRYKSLKSSWGVEKAGEALKGWQVHLGGPAKRPPMRTKKKKNAQGGEWQGTSALFEMAQTMQSFCYEGGRIRAEKGGFLSSLKNETGGKSRKG